MAQFEIKATTGAHAPLDRVANGRPRIPLSYKSSIIVALVIIPLAGWAIRDTTGSKTPKPVAEINGEQIQMLYWQERVQLSRVNLEISLQQFRDYQLDFGLDTSRQQADIQSYLRAPERLGAQVLNQLIAETVTRQEAKQRGIRVTETEVEAKAHASAMFFYNGVPVPSVTPIEFSVPQLTRDQLARAAASPAASALAPANRAMPAPSGELTERSGQPRDTTKGVDVSEATVHAVFEHQLYREKLLAAVSTTESSTR